MNAIRQRGLWFGWVMFSFFLLPASVPGQEGSQEAFHAWARDYVLSQQRASAFRLDKWEQLDYGALRDLIRRPYDEEFRRFAEQLDALDDPDERDRLREEFRRDRDARAMKAFREQLFAGRHSEAHVYYGLLDNELPNLPLANQWAYELYQRGYLEVQGELQAFAEAAAQRECDCRPLGGGPVQRLRVTVLEGPVCSNPQAVAELFAGAQPPTDYDWPYFPPLDLLLGLSDGSEPPWSSVIQADVRHYDRTTGEVLRHAAEWMTGRWGYYEPILAERGLAAAQEEFRRNLEVTATADDPNWLEVRDLGAQTGFTLQRTAYGAVVQRKKWGFLRRCDFVRGDQGEAAPRAWDGLALPPEE